MTNGSAKLAGMMVKDDIMANLSYEIRAPLNTSLGIARIEQFNSYKAEASESVERIEEFLKRIPVFSRLLPSQLTGIAHHTQKRQFNKGQYIFLDEDHPKFLFAVIYGQVKLSIPSAGGNEKVVNISGANQIFGEASIFSDKPYQFNVEALTDSLVLCVGKEAIAGLIHSNTQFAECFCTALCTRVHGLVREIGTIALKNACQRVADYLLQHCPETSPKVPVEIILPVAKQIIASMLNLTPESFSRVIYDLREAKILRTEGRHIYILNVNGLRQLCS